MTEQHLNMRPLIACFDVAFGENTDNALIKALFQPFTHLPVRKATDNKSEPLPKMQDNRTGQEVMLDISGASVLNGMTFKAFPDFGLFIFKSKRIHMSIRCGPIGQYGKGGHAHTDQLGITLEVDGTPWIRDPGSFCYTSDPDLRNTYRSAAAHFIPYCFDNETRHWSLGPFTLDQNVRRFGWMRERNQFQTLVEIDGDKLFFDLKIADNQITTVTKQLNQGGSGLTLRPPGRKTQHIWPDNPKTPVSYSPGYGEVEDEVLSPFPEQP
jgi:hypothetical protein